MPDNSSEVLSVPQCWELLESASLGHLALSIWALPAILPVQYRVEEGAIAISLEGHRVPAHVVDKTIAAFEVDVIDLRALTGWSVQALGSLRLFDWRLPASDGFVASSEKIVRLSPARLTGGRIDLGVPTRSPRFVTV